MIDQEPKARSKKPEAPTKKPFPTREGLFCCNYSGIWAVHRYGTIVDINRGHLFHPLARFCRTEADEAASYRFRVLLILILIF
jgi:hypothetical protein